MSELATVLQTHRNPVVREAALPELEGKTNVEVTQPMAYGDFTRMLSVADVALTHRPSGLPRAGERVVATTEQTSSLDDHIGDFTATVVRS